MVLHFIDSDDWGGMAKHIGSFGGTMLVHQPYNAKEYLMAHMSDGLGLSE